MALLQDKDKNDLKKHFEELKNDVTIINFTQPMECYLCSNTRQLLEEVTEMSEKIHLEVYNFTKDTEMVEKYKIKRIPSTVITGPGRQDFGIRFYGVPAGYEFPTLIEDILDISGKESTLKQQTIDTLKALENPVHIQVLVTLTCPYCPTAVRTAHKFALISDKVKADMIDAQAFPDVSVKYNVSSVPKIVMNETLELTGAQPEHTFLKYVQAAAKIS